MVTDAKNYWTWLLQGGRGYVGILARASAECPPVTPEQLRLLEQLIHGLEEIREAQKTKLAKAP